MKDDVFRRVRWGGGGLGSWPVPSALALVCYAAEAGGGMSGILSPPLVGGMAAAPCFRRVVLMFRGLASCPGPPPPALVCFAAQARKGRGEECLESSPLPLREGLGEGSRRHLVYGGLFWCSGGDGRALAPLPRPSRKGRGEECPGSSPLPLREGLGEGGGGTLFPARWFGVQGVTVVPWHPSPAPPAS